jgi:hypothetical protein
MIVKTKIIESKVDSKPTGNTMQVRYPSHTISCNLEGKGRGNYVKET